jgi:hypothetical protein
VANFRIEMISSGGLGRTNQKSLHARIDHDPRFFVRVKVQRLQTLNQLRDTHLFVEMDREQRRARRSKTLRLSTGRPPAAVMIRAS